MIFYAAGIILFYVFLLSAVCKELAHSEQFIPALIGLGVFFAIHLPVLGRIMGWW